MTEAYEFAESDPACTGVRARLPLYAMGDLPAAEFELTARHLELCAACRATLEEHRKIVGLLRREMPFRRHLFHGQSH